MGNSAYMDTPEWFNLAAAQGHENAIERRDALALQMTTAQILEAQRAARDARALAP